MGDIGAQGVRGLKALGVRELSYRLSFLACAVEADKTYGIEDLSELTAESAKEKFTEAELREIVEISRSEQLYQVMTNSIAPHVFGTLLSLCVSPCLSVSLRVSPCRPLSLLRFFLFGTAVIRSATNELVLVCRSRGGEARHPADALWRRTQSHARADTSARRHQRVCCRRPVRLKVPVPQVRSLTPCGLLRVLLHSCFRVKAVITRFTRLSSDANRLCIDTLYLSCRMRSTRPARAARRPV